jgi:hypothetical protein
MTLSQQKKIQTMLLNFQITSQIKDVTEMTTEFLNQMGTVSKEMIKLTDDKNFKKISKEFEIAMNGVSSQGEKMELFIENAEESYKDISVDSNEVTDREVMALIIDASEFSEVESEISYEKYKSSLKT